MAKSRKLKLDKNFEPISTREGDSLAAARTYIVNAPASIDTPIRGAVEEEAYKDMP